MDADGDLFYVPEIIDDNRLDQCHDFIAAYNAGDRNISLGVLIEVCETLYRAVVKLQSVEYVLAMRESIEANLRTHANFPIQGSKRQEDVEAGVPWKKRRDCDCDLCINGRRALAGRGA